MAVPSSGQLREYADIGVELGVAQTNVSLRGMSQTAGFSAPDAMSEFYGYSSVPSTQFKAVIYTGNGAPSKSITGIGFSPDLVIINNRPSAVSPTVPYDRVRGAGQWMPFYSTAQQYYYSTVVKTFDADGFTVGNDVDVNGNGGSYVAWCFKAGGAAVSNTNGSITSQVSASDGFSIATWAGQFGSIAGSTVGHGLPGAPEMVIVKGTWTSTQWFVWHNALPTTRSLRFDTDDSYLTFPAWGITSTTISSNWSTSNGNWLAYCFRSVAGKVKVGTYTGNGSGGTVINVGFQPSWVLIKSGAASGDAAGAWHFIDSARGTNYISFTENVAEVNYNAVSFVSNGFRLNLSSDLNNNGKTFPYVAII